MATKASKHIPDALRGPARAVRRTAVQCASRARCARPGTVLQTASLPCAVPSRAALRPDQLRGSRLSSDSAGAGVLGALYGLSTVPPRECLRLSARATNPRRVSVLLQRDARRSLALNFPPSREGGNLGFII